MKNTRRLFVVFTFIVASLVLVPNVFAGDPIRERPLQILNPVVMAQGGSFTANTTGYPSLFTNPAGFGSSRGHLTIASFNPWFHTLPDNIPELIRAVELMGGDEGDDEMFDFLVNEITTNGLGLGFAGGIGYTGRGLGLGVTVAGDAFISGRPFPFGVKGVMTSEVSLVGGLALPITFGPARFSLGANVRPFMRVHAPMGSAEVAALLGGFFEEDDDADDPFGNLTALNGFGIAIDAGLIAEFSALSFGLSVRDLGNTRLNYSRDSMSDVMDALDAGGLPPGATEADGDRYVAETHEIPMRVNLGAAFRPISGPLSILFDPVIHGQITDVFDNASEKPTSIWTRVHLGTEVRLLRFLSARAGLNQGYVTLGGGVHLLFLDVNFAVYTREMGRNPGDKPSSGASIEASIRF
ncbi:MAG: hypothetical protein EA426_14115 [Spirochaetaceae bacterium]|nr:MAG: hypothetical protein EA426_14115 [Spirochaetaceae bacterium]